MAEELRAFFFRESICRSLSLRSLYFCLPPPWISIGNEVNLFVMEHVAVAAVTVGVLMSGGHSGGGVTLITTAPLLTTAGLTLTPTCIRKYQPLTFLYMHRTLSPLNDYESYEAHQISPNPGLTSDIRSIVITPTPHLPIIIPALALTQSNTP
ncbi:hypothetical protein E2C01_005388 [Portunus trituberculatus]|uniref:Uncharacterized protein n=1 Tax=Portunus trituberculatus TaxID=210409 RepID=A0A5B7CSM9_PORTR|nr:hypothetical protein [Portunus trituberculatus]